MWQHGEGLPPRELTQALVSRDFTGISYTGMQCLCGWPQLFLLQVFRANTDIYPKSHLLAGTIWSNWYCMAQGTSHTKTFLSGRIFKALRAHLLGVGQEPVMKTGLSWKWTQFEQPRSAKLMLSCVVVNYKYCSKAPPSPLSAGGYVLQPQVDA